MKGFRVLVLVLLTACSAVTTTAQRLLDDLLADGGPTPLKLEAPQVERQSGPNGGDVFRAYQAGDTPLLLLARYGRPLDERRLATVAQSLARAHFAVLVPSGSPGFLPPADAEQEIGRAIDSLDGKVIIMALSLSVAPALRAAGSRPDRIAGFVAIGGAADLRSRWHDLWGEAPQTAWRILNGVWEFAAPQRDRTLLAGIAARKADDLGAAIDDLKRQLSPDGLDLLKIAESGGSEMSPNVAAMVDRLSAPPGAKPWPMIVINGTDDPTAPSAGGFARAIDAPSDGVYQLDVLAQFGSGELSIHDRRLWLKAISEMLGWVDAR